MSALYRKRSTVAAVWRLDWPLSASLAFRSSLFDGTLAKIFVWSGCRQFSAVLDADLALALLSSSPPGAPAVAVLASAFVRSSGGAVPAMRMPSSSKAKVRFVLHSAVEQPWLCDMTSWIGVQPGMILRSHTSALLSCLLIFWKSSRLSLTSTMRSPSCTFLSAFSAFHSANNVPGFGLARNMPPYVVMPNLMLPDFSKEISNSFAWLSSSDE
mmetsp:Transcript_46227/g.148430  ORF Transcript_46227/g.148430 Transcript_46227/m.148430 type:complete len:213 (+) Transcript_46227:464-1102(+)